MRTLPWWSTPSISAMTSINSVVRQQNQNGEEGARDLAEEGDMNGEQDSAATE